MYSILPDTRLGYPFLCDSISSTFYSIGSTLRWATLLPSLYAYITVVLGVYLFFEDWFRRDSVAVLATVLFFIGGGFGFWYFFDSSKTMAGLTSSEAWNEWLNEVYGVSVAGSVNGGPVDMGRMLMEGWYKTPTNFVDHGLRWVNSIADMLLPQRATLFGWALLFPALQLLRRAVLDGEKKLFLSLGVLAGAMPLVHTHSFFALGLISAFLFAAELIAPLFRKKDAKGVDRKGRLLYFFLFGVIAVALAAPQLFGFTFRQSSAGGFLKFHFNWCNESDSWLWFYVKNLGFIFILMLPAFLAAKRETKLFYAGSLVIWALCEFVVFQPNTYDNNKLLFVWFAMTCGIVAELIVKLWDRLTRPVYNEKGEAQKRPLGVKLACFVGFAALIVSMTLSGVMTLAREYVSGDHIAVRDGSLQKVENGYEVVSSDLVELTDWMRGNIPEDATILTATNHNNAVAMLTGRNIVCGSPTFLYFHGVDYSERHSRVKQMYQDPASCFDGYAAEYGVDYVLISPWETSSYAVDRSWFAGRFTPVFESGGAILYKVN
ncbi:MAG: hypothetical protein II756_05120, partial [Clostridia bacterium]|nr:hypothetical protein [Clostridia bacterium]